MLAAPPPAAAERRASHGAAFAPPPPQPPSQLSQRHMLAAQQHLGAIFGASAQQQQAQQQQRYAAQQHPSHQQHPAHHQFDMHHPPPPHPQLVQQFPYWAGPTADEAYLRHMMLYGAAPPPQQAQQAPQGPPQQQPLSDGASPPISGSGDSPYALHDFVMGGGSGDTPYGADVGGGDAPFLFGHGFESAWPSAGGTLDPAALSHLSVAGSSSGLGQRSTPGLSPSSMHSHMGGGGAHSSGASLGDSPPHSGYLPGTDMAAYDAAVAGIDTSLLAPFQFDFAAGFAPKEELLGAELDRKRAAPESTERPAKAPRPSVSAASRKASTSAASRKRSRADETASAAAAAVPAPAPVVNASGLPHMEVGSNATAQAAIQRIKQRQAAAAAAAAAASAPSVKQASSSTSEPAAAAPAAGSSSAAAARPASSEKAQRKVAHNAIERRYRNNINDRIAALRAAVPALHNPKPLPGGRRGKRGRAQAELVDGVPAASKLNKATILGTATAYIRVLKQRELRLTSEAEGLRQLVKSLEGGDELLELWQAEMQKVAEAEAVKSEDDELLDDDDDEDDDEDDDDEDVSTESVRPVARKRGGSGPSRVLTGAVLSVAFFGDSANDAPAGPHPAARALGAAHQLVRRSGVLDDAEPHHLDAAPTSALALDVVRIVAFAAIATLLLWPVFSRLFRRRKAAVRQLASAALSHDAAAAAPELSDEEQAERLQRHQALLDVLARSHPDAREINSALRAFVVAPTHVLCSGYGLILESAKVLRLAVGLKPVGPPVTPEEGAVWVRLLEVETSLGPLAQPSLLARLYTLMRVSAALERGTLARAHAHATLALALLRALPGNALAERWAAASWERARRVRLIAADDTSAEERWLDPVLRLTVQEALALAPAPTDVIATFKPSAASAVRAAALSPLLSIASRMHCTEASEIWTAIFASVVRSSCPASADESDLARDFLNHTSSFNLELDIAAEEASRESMTQRIAALVAVAPPSLGAPTLARTTLGAWSLMLGNVALARNVAQGMLQSGEAASSPAAQALAALLLPASSSAEPAAASADALDILACTTLRWLLFLRSFSSLRLSRSLSDAQRDELLERATALRVQLATLAAPGASLGSHRRRRGAYSARRRASADSTASESSSRCASPLLNGAAAPPRVTGVEDARDALTDVLTALARRAAHKNARLWDDDEAHDSGIEWI